MLLLFARVFGRRSSEPAFEVASVKPVEGLRGTMYNFSSSGPRVRYIAYATMQLVMEAYNVNNKPFIRFLIFGPSGQLLPSVNLDGRREKFVPGTCVVCHGGDHYAGKFPEDGSGFANVGGHFLPYDVGNFEFASKPGLQKCDQENAIYHLNQNVLNAGPTVAEQELIAGNPGWYTATAAGTWPSSVTNVLNENFVPVSWAFNPSTVTASTPTRTPLMRAALIAVRHPPRSGWLDERVA